MSRIRRLPGMESFKPPRPCRTDPEVALRIATAVVLEINRDTDSTMIYWEKEIENERIWQLQQALIANVPAHNLGRWIVRRLSGRDDFRWSNSEISYTLAQCFEKIARRVYNECVDEWKRRYDIQGEFA